ncbi:MAG: pyruvate, phosphate dikinase [Leptospiraceae bacterium]|nr:pyruvate, phosphate dikinase [Leptospiraceae bacterium]MDW8306696.1 pyruvate, phosphate dikinase [Leptospiraceae bacterium]
MGKKYVYFFGAGLTEGRASDKLLLGGKGANLAEMTLLGIPVPPGFTISTEACTYFYENEHRFPPELMEQIKENLEKLSGKTGKVFGDAKNPLLVSVRSGAPVSMPGMMDTILNLGLNKETVRGLMEKTGNPRFAYDSYRRFIQMFSQVVLSLEHDDFEHMLDNIKKKYHRLEDKDLSAEELQELVENYLAYVREKTGQDFPQDVMVQLEMAIRAVFLSWMNPRAVTYRKLHDISEKLGTAVTVQAMVFGNMGDDSGTGVGFTRSPINGEKRFFAEFLMNAQGEDVVAGIRTPFHIEKLCEIMPSVYEELHSVAQKLEAHYRDMQDIEFTIENKKLYLLQTRTGKRTAFAAVRIAVEMVEEGLIDEKTAVKRVDPASLPSLLANIFDEADKARAKKEGKVMARGLPAGPGAASGKMVFSAEKAVEWAKKGEQVILVRIETSPEDISGMHSALGILTARGGMTSHAAVVARGMNKPCIVGCASLMINYKTGILQVRGEDGKLFELKEGDYISIDGFTGEVLSAHLRTIPSEIEQVFIEKTLPIEKSLLAQHYQKLMEWADRFARLKVRTNADTERDARVARSYGAQGIGLCRTEHMFFAEDRILAVRQMILADTEEERREAIQRLLPYQREDFKAIFRVMASLPVTIRLLDPPLHEFLPQDEEVISELAMALRKEVRAIKQKIDELKEFNPMLGHRGCRLGISYPEITEMQARAIFEAATELTKEGYEVYPEIMVPLVGHWKELKHQEELIRKVADEVAQESGVKVSYILGTMIEVPRAAITADEIAEYAEFFSFGTNDLTQMGAGFSRDDSEHFLPRYLELGIYEKNPFQVLDREGIGKLIKIACELGRKTRPDIKLGVCGEHGGDPSSIAFCHEIGLDYVSCSPYRVPIARLAAAQAALS